VAPATSSAPQVGSLPPLPPPSRPLGVAILAVLVGLFGLILVIAGGLLLFDKIGTAALNTYYLGQPTSLGPLTTIELEAIVFVVGLIILGLAVGLWHLRMWALALTLLFLAFVLIVDGIAGQFLGLGFLLSLVIFVYLIAVNGHFR
jgi:hypothetical protein